MRYAYGLTSALLVGGAALSLVTGYPAGAQVAQNDGSQMARVVPRSGAPESFADLTEQLQPAVVNIATRQRVEVEQRGNSLAELFGLPGQGGGQGGSPATREAQSLGSGFIVSEDGYVVTNNHVVSPSGRGTVEEITVKMPDGVEYEATLVGADPESDLAVLKIKSDKKFPFVKFGNSSQARAGDWVIAIGNPFGLGGTVTSGIVSAVMRNTGGGAYDRFIQTDASINRGNSGGPLFDMQGNVIGINNAILSPSGGSVGIGFAIPAETAAPIVEMLKKGASIERGYLGVSISPIDNDLADSLGLERNRGEFIQMVEAGQPAEKAGIKAGDIVLSVNNKAVTPDQTLSFLVANIKPGSSIPIEVLRDGKKQMLRATVAKRPTVAELRDRQVFREEESPDTPEEPAKVSPIINKLGLRGVAVNAEIARQLGVPSDTQGVAILAVDQNSDAAAKGLRRRDIILTANYQKLSSLEDLEAVINDAVKNNRPSVLLRFQRPGGAPAYRAIRLR